MTCCKIQKAKKNTYFCKCSFPVPATTYFPRRLPVKLISTAELNFRVRNYSIARDTNPKGVGERQAILHAKTHEKTPALSLAGVDSIVFTAGTSERSEQNKKSKPLDILF